MYPVQKQKKKHKGFNLLDAKFLESGVAPASADSRAIGLRAIGQTHAHSEKHHEHKEQKRETRFKSGVRKHYRRAVKLEIGSIRPVKTSRHERKGKQWSRADKDGSDTSKRSGSQEEE